MAARPAPARGATVAITRSALTDNAAKSELSAVVQAARAGARSLPHAAALIRDALEQLTAQPYAVVVARTAVMSARTAVGTATTLSMPGGAGSRPPWDAGPCSVIVFVPSQDPPGSAAPPAATGASAGKPSGGRRGSGSGGGVSLVRSAGLDAEQGVLAVAALVHARAAAGLGPTTDVACASAMRAELASRLGGSWGVALCPEAGEGAHPSGGAFPPACSAVLEAVVTPTAPPGEGGAPAYRALAYRVPPPPPPPGAVGWARQRGWTLARAAAYALAAGALVAYFAFTRVMDNHCARPAFVPHAAARGGWGWLTGGGGASVNASAAGAALRAAAYANPAPPGGCSEAQAQAAERRLALAQPLMHAGLGCLVVAALLRMSAGAARRGRVRATLREVASGAGEGRAAAKAPAAAEAEPAATTMPPSSASRRGGGAVKRR